MKFIWPCHSPSDRCKLRSVSLPQDEDAPAEGVCVDGQNPEVVYGRVSSIRPIWILSIKWAAPADVSGSQLPSGVGIKKAKGWQAHIPSLTIPLPNFFAASSCMGRHAAFGFLLHCVSVGRTTSWPQDYNSKKAAWNHLSGSLLDLSSGFCQEILRGSAPNER